jgi:Zn-dependent M32 family carboxypeptidase
MNNIFRLFEQQRNESPSNDATVVKNVVTNILGLSARLVHTLNELSRHLDAFDEIIDALDDSDTRNRLKQILKRSREKLTNDVSDLSQKVGKLPNLQRELAEALARCAASQV